MQFVKSHMSHDLFFIPNIETCKISPGGSVSVEKCSDTAVFNISVIFTPQCFTLYAAGGNSVGLCGFI